MKTHVLFGAKILEPLVPLADSWWSCTTTNSLTVPLSPRSCWRKIPLGAASHHCRFDTITSDRSYKKGRTSEQALNELERCANSQFDARLVQVFVRAMRQLPNPIIEVASLIARNT
jgi:hypothetical protein